MKILRPLAILIVLSLSATLLIQAQDDDLSDILPLSADLTYTVRSSDTLDTIGTLFDVSPVCIAETNDIELNGGLSIGQQLLIAVDCPIYGADPTYNAQGFVRNPRAGIVFDNTCDSGYRIAGEVNFTMAGMVLNVDDAGLQASNVSNDDGDCLDVASGSLPFLDVPTDDEGQGGASRIYIMRAGDTVDTVAARFDIAVESVLMTNDIERSEARFLVSGTRLIIPTGAPEFGVVPANDPDFDPEQGGAGAAYVVQPGDVLDSIAAGANLDLACLQEANNISNAGDIFPGDVIVLDGTCPPYRGLGAPLSSFITTADATSESGGGETTEEDSASDEEATPLGG
ncbi:MAG: LysM peptidoglycan-binding domain-containing protein [Aggregatilineales bacterium]